MMQMGRYTRSMRMKVKWYLMPTYRIVDGSLERGELGAIRTEPPGV
jgi:hypothetical protein